MMRLKILLIIGMTFSCLGCNKVFDNPTISSEDVILELWEHIDDNYSFFELKQVNWDSVKTSALARIRTDLTDEELFQICADMTYVLKDGHVKLYNGETTLQFDFTEGYDVHFDLELVERKYLNGNFERNSNYTYGIINDSIGYLHLSAFARISFFENVIDYYREQEVQRLIIDVRDNGGGDTELGINMIEYLITAPASVAYLQYKSGEDHNAFIDPIEIVVTPKQNNFPLRTNILINRSSYSASSIFSSMVQDVAGFTLIGQVTGGGGCGGQSYELPNGWVIDVPQCYYLDAKMNHIELGVNPDIVVENTRENLINQEDAMLETAIAN